MKIAVTGSSGLIGTELTASLRADGHDVITLVRRTPRTATEHRWDPAHRQVPAGLLDDVDAVVNLAGVGIGDKRWTASYKREVLDSRVDSTATISQALADAVRADPSRPRTLLSASAVGYYGDTGDRTVDETAPSGTGFLADVCRQWEAATEPAQAAGVRVALLRTGLVLARGGLLKKLAPLFKLALGGKLGSGAQYWPWISLRDEVAAIRFLLEHPVSGPVNLTGPVPVTNAEFTAAMASVVHRPAVVQVPGFALSIVLGDFAQEGVLGGQRAVPAALAAAGFRHADTDVTSALRSALG
ncbi:TIGR01777 family protein [Modestobacter sp. I12A-02628]|uniref:TIGR01777 family protein n=1 Tax=Goekera deserti TaxID=2497753 RepID=A0A7K3WAN2_9ACTN|nr:TIGR01777 family oxidoreductase [Goekera deserti]MPQ97632.1 TIGR01777 family protein [Goekera deserti]NDI47763.1 TIGR01777 family protein [Goekera deserti]NEL53511.1 TIGR01777 family protein [Goekera deserti]